MAIVININIQLEKKHNIKAEIIPGKLGGLLKSDLVLTVDQKTIYNQTLRTHSFKKVSYSFKIEQKTFTLNYHWIIAVWKGKLYIEDIEVKLPFSLNANEPFEYKHEKNENS